MGVRSPSRPQEKSLVVPGVADAGTTVVIVNIDVAPPGFRVDVFATRDGDRVTSIRVELRRPA